MRILEMVGCPGVGKSSVTHALCLLSNKFRVMPPGSGDHDKEHFGEFLKYMRRAYLISVERRRTEPSKVMLRMRERDYLETLENHKHIAIMHEGLLQSCLSLSLAYPGDESMLRRAVELVPLPDYVVHLTAGIESIKARNRLRGSTRVGNKGDRSNIAPEMRRAASIVAETVERRGLRTVSIDTTGMSPDQVAMKIMMELQNGRAQRRGVTELPRTATSHARGS